MTLAARERSLRTAQSAAARAPVLTPTTRSMGTLRSSSGKGRPRRKTRPQSRTKYDDHRTVLQTQTPPARHITDTARP